jgi:hypothetical protein
VLVSHQRFGNVIFEGQESINKHFGFLTPEDGLSRLSRNVDKKYVTTTRYAISQQSAVLSYFAAETRNHARCLYLDVAEGNMGTAGTRHSGYTIIWSINLLTFAICHLIKKN